MDASPDKQIENELRKATGLPATSVASSKPRVSTGKLRKPSARPQRNVMPVVRPRKAGANKNLRRLEGGPSRDTFDQLSSPEREKPKSRVKPVLNGPFSPRREETRNVNHRPLRYEPIESQAAAGAGPVLTAPHGQTSPHCSPRKRFPKPVTPEAVAPSEEEWNQFFSPVGDVPSQALANAVDTNTTSNDGRDDADAGLPIELGQNLEPAASNEAPKTTRRKTRNPRCSKPIASEAREPASAGKDRSSPQVVVTKVVIPKPKRIRPGSLYPVGEDTSEASSDNEEHERPRQRLSHHTVHSSNYRERNDQQRAQPSSEQAYETSKQPKKRKAAHFQVPSQPAKNAKRQHQIVNLGQNHELYDQQSVLREAYQTAGEIGWAYKDGKKHSRSDVDLDDDQVKALKKLCGKAKSKLSSLKEPMDDDEFVSDPPEEFARISDEVRTLRTTTEYLGDENKVNNIYFHLFPNLLELLRQTVDLYGEMDKGEQGLTPERSITVHHLGVVVSLIGLITSLHDTMQRKYCEPQPGLCVKAAVRKIALLLRSVQERFFREISQHHRKEQQKLEDIARAEEDVLLEERHRREEAIAEQRAAIRNKWLHLHDERRHADVNILPRWKLAHLRVPELEPDRDGNGEPFERVEVFAPRFGPSVASMEKARQVEWTAVELDALRTGLEEFAGPRLFVKLFRRYCTRGRPLNRFNVTEIVTLAADMRQWVEDQQRRSGGVQDWVLDVKPYMWTKPKIHGSGQENF